MLLDVDDGGTLRPIAQIPANSPLAVQVADFNRDGWLDIAATSATPDQIDVFMGLADGGFALVQRLATGNEPDALCSGDLNGDGVPDLITPNAFDKSISVYVSS